MVETVPFQPDVTGTVNSPARPHAGLAWPQEWTQSVTRKAPTLTAGAVVEGGSLEEFAGQWLANAARSLSLINAVKRGFLPSSLPQLFN